MRQSVRRESAMTLLELLVTLVLSTLVLGMALPLLAELTRPSPRLNVSELPAWEHILQADLRELVSSEKCAVPVLQVIPASDTQPYPQLILETFCRAGNAIKVGASRCPSEVCYRKELDPVSGKWMLVRIAKGWHDDFTSKHVLATGISDWTVNLENDSETIGGVMRVTLTSGQTPTLFWVPRLTPRTTPPTQSSGQMTIMPGAMR